MLLAAVFVRRCIKATATSKSSSAQRIHSRVAGFIHHLALAQNRAGETVFLAHFSRPPDKQVHGKRGFNPSTNFHHLVRCGTAEGQADDQVRSEEHTSELQSL